MTALSANTQAILLLTAPLILGRRASSIKPLTTGEYEELASHLRKIKREPKDLISQKADEILEDCQKIVAQKNLQNLLGRGLLLSQASERWARLSIWVVSRADSSYPQGLKAKMGGKAPPILYGCGDRKILDTGGLAVVGSRYTNETLLENAEKIGELAAQARRSIVSGGARGIDQTAMRGALGCGGKATGVLANGLEKAAMNYDNRDYLMDDKLVLVSPCDPAAGFLVGNAMQRNKLIYAFSDAALIVCWSANKGGTWAGATEQLKRLKYVPIYVRAPDSEQLDGLEALLQAGAVPWPNPKTPDEFRKIVSPSSAKQSSGQQPPSSPNMATQRSGINSQVNAHGATHSDDALFTEVRRLFLPFLKQPRTPKEVQEKFKIILGQTKAWLLILTGEGVIERKKGSIRYVVAGQTFNQRELFPSPTPSTACEALPEVGADNKGPEINSQLNAHGATHGDDALFTEVRRLFLPFLKQPRTPKEVQEKFKIILGQTKAWLLILTGEGVIERKKGSIRYVVAGQTSDQQELFPPPTHPVVSV